MKRIYVSFRLYRRAIGRCGMVITLSRALRAVRSDVLRRRFVSHALSHVGDRPVPMQYSDVLSIVDAIHADGNLPDVAVYELPPDVPELSPGTLGIFVRRRRAIAVRWDHQSSRIVFLHEIGHLLDFDGIGISGEYASETDDLMEGWRSAVRTSRAAQEWIRLQTTSFQDHHLRNGRIVRTPVDLGHVAMCMQYREYFARSYAQYIAINSRDPTLIADINSAIAAQRYNIVSYPEQWDDDDFEPIGVAFDRLMNDLGWR
jgi:hypothetical protein